jgi:hypothetical protein
MEKLSLSGNSLETFLPLVALPATRLLLLLLLAEYLIALM